MKVIMKPIIGCPWPPPCGLLLGLMSHRYVILHFYYFTAVFPLPLPPLPPLCPFFPHFPSPSSSPSLPPPLSRDSVSRALVRASRRVQGRGGFKGFRPIKVYEVLTCIRYKHLNSLTRKDLSFLGFRV